MRSSLYTLRLLLGLLTFTLLVACDDSGSGSASATPEEINTLNLYLSNNKVFSFNPNSGRSVERAEFSSGNDMTFSLNTDEDKQGYEFLAYVKDDSIYIMNYIDAKISKLAVAANNICGIFPSFTASQSSFDDRPQKRILIHQPIIMIAIENEGNCNKETDLLYQVAFDPSGDDGTVITEIKPGLIYGTNLLDFAFSETITGNGPPVTLIGRSGFLGYDRDGKQIQLYDNDNKLLWETPLTNVDVIRQTGRSEVLIQADQALFVLNIGELFDITTLTDESAILPMNSSLQTLLETPSYTLSVSDTEVETASNDSAFYFQDDNSIYLYQDSNETNIFTNEDSNIEIINFGITLDNSLLLRRRNTANDSMIFSQVDPDTRTEITWFDEAEYLEFFIFNNDFYVNTLNAQGAIGWQAHRIEDSIEGQQLTTYDNSLFIFLNDARSRNESILLLSSDDTPSQPMQQPGIYVFDENKIGARGTRYGQLSSNVYFAHQSAIINDIYGLLHFDTLNDGDISESYYFKPTQDNSENSSLQLMID